MKYLQKFFEWAYLALAIFFAIESFTVLTSEPRDLQTGLVLAFMAVMGLGMFIFKRKFNGRTR